MNEQRLFPILVALLIIFPSGSCWLPAGELDLIEHTSNRDPSRETQYNPWKRADLLAGQVEAGGSFSNVNHEILRYFVKSTNNYLSSYPFQKRLPANASTNRIVMWQSVEIQPSGWPLVLFGIFNPCNQELLDLILVDDYRKIPLIAGLYQKNLESLRQGLSAERMYDLLGKDKCDYVKLANGRWSANFIYQGYHGRFYRVEVDAAQGLISKVEQIGN